MKKLIFLTLLAVATFGYAQTSSQSDFKAYLNTVQQKADGFQQKFDSTNVDWKNVRNNDTFKSYQRRFAENEGLLNRKQRYLEDLIAQKASQYTIKTARDDLESVIKKYNSLKNEYERWVNSLES